MSCWRIALLVLLILAATTSAPASGMPALGAVEATVNQSLGAANYSIPVDVPPGPGDLKPSISIVYSSRANDGLLGIGWQLPISEISCSTRFGVPDYSNCPRYEFEGQLLDTASTGPGVRFHPFVQTFERIKFDQLTDSWSVESPSGVTRRYGQADQSRVRETEDPSSPVARWLLDEISDKYGNTIQFEYASFAGDKGVRYPRLISYANGKRSVFFDYGLRGDPIRDFRGGVARVITHRLQQIYVISNGNPTTSSVGSTGQVYQRRTFEYDTGSYQTGRTRLARTQLFGTDCPLTIVDPTAGCVGSPAVDFVYSDNTGTQYSGGPFAGGWDPSPEYVHYGLGSLFAGSWPTLFGDVDGDGITDQVEGGVIITAAGLENVRELSVKLGDPAAGWVEDPAWTAALEQLDGYEQGRLTVDQAAYPFQLTAAGVGFVAVPAAMMHLGSALIRHFGSFLHPTVGEPWPPGVSPTFVQDAGNFLLVDINGDGLADLVTSVQVGGITLSDGTYAAGGHLPQVFRNTGRGWEKDADLASGLPPLSTIRAELFSTLPFDGDYTCTMQGMWGGDSSFLGDLCVNNHDYSPSFVDLNGDGLSDLLVAEPIDPSTHTLGHGALRTVAWVQNPAGGVRWERAEEFDRPLGTLIIRSDYALGDPLTGHGGAFCGLVGAADCTKEFTWNDGGAALVDINNDGLTDVLWSNGVSEGVAINRGKGDAPGSAWCTTDDDCGWAEIYKPPEVVNYGSVGSPNPASFIDVAPPPGTKLRFLDVNGDGLKDVVKISVQSNGYIPPTSELDVWLHSPQDALGPGNRVWQNVAVADFGPFVGVSTEIGEVEEYKYVPMDLNGDATVDYLGSDSSMVSQGPSPDLLTQVTNGRGATLSFEYAWAPSLRDGKRSDANDPLADSLEGLAQADLVALGEQSIYDDGAVQSEESGLWHWYPRPLVTRATVDPGFGLPASVTGFEYAHPRWCPKHRAGHGFRLVRASPLDNAGAPLAHRDSYFYQQHALAGKASSTLTSSGGAVMARIEDDWEIASATVPGGANQAGLEVHVARLRERRTFNEYSSGRGAERVQTLNYDDAHGYNFLSVVVDDRQTGTLRTEFDPVPANVADWFVSQVAEVRQESADVLNVLLSRSQYSYNPLGKPESVREHVQHRDLSDTASEYVTTLEYDSLGNPSRVREAVGTPEERTTEFCYDGDACAWWAPPQGVTVGDSHSVRVAMLDPMGGVTQTLPDLASGRIVQMVSSYTDIPELRVELDPFGRVIQEWATPEAGAEFLRSAVTYNDHVLPNSIEERAYADRAVGGEVWSAVVLDGLGQEWRTVLSTEVDAGYVGAATFRDPVTRSVRRTLPESCQDSICDGLVGNTEPLANLVQRDAIGRHMSIQTVDGTTTFTYDRLERTWPIYGGVGVFDSILIHDGNGNETRRLMDGQRVVWVDECHAANGSCTSRDETFYTYQQTGETARIYNSRATALSSWGDPASYVHFEYDTLGRVWKIQDPDAGVGSAGYDAFGNQVATTNARGQQTLYVHDVLDRTVTIDRPVPEGDTHFSYRTGELQRHTETGSSYSKSFDYDDMGRVKRQEHNASGIGSASLLLDFEYDELGRVTAVVYPDDSTVAVYEYDGLHLERMCEVQALGEDCGGTAAFAHLSSVAYDDLGRVEETVVPFGTRRFEYGADHRIFKDEFTGAYNRSLTYPARDGLGNITAVAATGGAGSVDFASAYEYDHRNRIKSWTHELAQYHYRYDDLGNMIAHGVLDENSQNQAFDAQKPHAIAAQLDSGTSYVYDADGNLKERVGQTSSRHFSFDSAGRLAGVGTTSGQSDVLEVAYDASGSRVRDVTAHPGGFLQERFYAGEHFSLLVKHNGADSVGDYHFLALGRQISLKRKSPPSIRTTALGVLLEWWPTLGPPVAIQVFAGVALGLALLGLLVPLAGGSVEPWPRPAVCLSLAMLLLVPPLPARAGGGGPSVNRWWFLEDPTGTVGVVLANDGSVVREVVYTPFGAPHEESAGDPLDSSIFAGHRLEQESGLHYMRARWYDSGSGTFLSVDPVIADVADPQSFNAYAYVRNNPVSYTDPTGMCPPQKGESCTWPVQVAGESYTATAWMVNVSVDVTISIDTSFQTGSAGSSGGFGGGSSSGFGGASSSVGSSGGVGGGAESQGGADQAPSDPIALPYGDGGTLFFPPEGVEGPPALEVMQTGTAFEWIAGPVRSLGLGRGILARAAERMGFYPTKVGGGGRLQYFSTATGRYVAYSATFQARVAPYLHNPPVHGVIGFGQGLMQSQGAEPPPAITRAQRWGQAVGRFLGSALGN